MRKHDSEPPNIYIIWNIYSLNKHCDSELFFNNRLVGQEEYNNKELCKYLDRAPKPGSQMVGGGYKDSWEGRS